jgi:hypothetical protein
MRVKVERLACLGCLGNRQWSMRTGIASNKEPADFLGPLYFFNLLQKSVSCDLKYKIRQTTLFEGN